MEDQSKNQMETIIECTDLDGMVAFCTDVLGCRLELITPADDPTEYVVAGHGARLRLVRSDTDHPIRLRLTASSELGDDEREICAPDGSVVELVPLADAVSIPENEPTLSVVRAGSGDEFGTGRAGMGYRDLLPDRWGGRFIASHILITDGGDVADYVHFHRIRFQMIFVAAGWVDVVYEDQGEPFRMYAGDCVLQPPEIRHRVLRSSPGLEVIEIGCPAEHDTIVEHSIGLPTVRLDPDRDFSGQRFVRHIAADSAPDVSAPCRDGFVHRDTGIAVATNGLADAQVLTMPLVDAAPAPTLSHGGEFAMSVVLAGSAQLAVEFDGNARVVDVAPRDAVALPPGSTWTWANRTTDFELLQVVLPVGCVHVAEVDHAR
jgi:mannose-6-phosphate isomerase-like protein (cupin superfamily)